MTCVHDDCREPALPYADTCPGHHEAVIWTEEPGNGLKALRVEMTPPHPDGGVA